MFDHLGLPVADVQASKRFYAAALAPLGYRVTFESEHAVAFGAEFPQLWLTPGGPGEPVHVALMSPDRAAVGRFHEAALAAGGRDNGGPGLREHYAPTYYAAYVLDPDGNNVEAVCHKPE